MIKFCLYIFLMIGFNINAATSVSSTITAIASNEVTENVTPANEMIQVNTIRYKESTSDSSEIIEWLETIKDGVRVVSTKTEKFSELTEGTNKTTKYSYTNPDDKIEIHVNVENNIANITATIDAKPITSSTPLKDIPFLYPPGFFLTEFINSDKQKQFIWVVSKSSATLSQMIFTKIGTEKIKIGDQEIECTKTEMKPTGMGGMFWKAYYWHDIKTKEFVRYFGKKGPPGTPDYTIDKIL